MASAGGSRPDVVVLDYGMGNLHSVAKGVERAGANVRLVEAAGEIGDAAGMVLPGVGNFGRCAENLAVAGLDQAVADWVLAARPFLGICVGMQLLFDGSDEAGAPGLGVLAGRVRRLPGSVRVPHMGWNTVMSPAGGVMFDGVEPGTYFYFVHSYAARLASDARDVAHPAGELVAVCEYGGAFAAAVEKGPVWVTQFHPEKSGDAGLALLGRFVGICT